MDRISLKTLRDMLNKVEDEQLSSMYLTHSGYSENPEKEFTFMFDVAEGSDEDSKLLELFEDGEPMKAVCDSFLVPLNIDLKVMLDEKRFDELTDDGCFEDPTVVNQ